MILLCCLSARGSTNGFVQNGGIRFERSNMAPEPVLKGVVAPFRAKARVCEDVQQSGHIPTAGFLRRKMKAFGGSNAQGVKASNEKRLLAGNPMAHQGEPMLCNEQDIGVAFGFVDLTARVLGGFKSLVMRLCGFEGRGVHGKRAHQSATDFYVQQLDNSLASNGSMQIGHRYSSVCLLSTYTLEEGGAVAQMCSALPLLMRKNALLRCLRGAQQTSLQTGSWHYELAA